MYTTTDLKIDRIDEQVSYLRRMLAKVVSGATLDKKWLSPAVFAKEVGTVTNSDGTPLNNQQMRYLRNEYPEIYNDRTGKYNMEKYNEILNA